jgi:hypothetical protein
VPPAPKPHVIESPTKASLRALAAGAPASAPPGASTATVSTDSAS